MDESRSIAEAHWYVVHTKPRQEFRALEQLQNQQYICFLPTLRAEKIRRGKVEEVLSPLFSRYLFVQLDMVATNWAPLRSTRGVSTLVAFGGRFATLPNASIDALKTVPDQIVVPLFNRGDKVAITGGALAGLEGVFQMADGDARAMVLIEILSREQRIKVDINALQKAA